MWSIVQVKSKRSAHSAQIIMQALTVDGLTTAKKHLIIYNVPCFIGNSKYCDIETYTTTLKSFPPQLLHYPQGQA